MLLLAYRSLPENQQLPADQRWRVIELEGFEDLDLSTGQGVAAAIKRVNAGTVPNVGPIPVGSQVFMIDTDMVEVPSWDLALTVTQTPAPEPDPPPETGAAVAEHGGSGQLEQGSPGGRQAARSRQDRRANAS